MHSWQLFKNNSSGYVLRWQLCDVCMLMVKKIFIDIFLGFFSSWLSSVGLFEYVGSEIDCVCNFSCSQPPTKMARKEKQLQILIKFQILSILVMSYHQHFSKYLKNKKQMT